MDDLNDLPQSVREIAEVIGREAALLLIGRLPVCYRDAGKKSPKVILYVPKRLPPDHQLVEILGYPTAQKLVDAFGGEILYPANCRAILAHQRNELVARMLDGGARPAIVAELFGMTERNVRNLQRKAKPSEIVPEENVPVDPKNNAGTYQPTEQEQWTNRQA